MTEEATQAAKETARQLLYLIEVVKMDADLQAEHIERLSLDPVADLTESVEDETIQHSDMLEDISNELVDINRNLVQFFRDEQDRFQIQQDMADEQYFRTLEALREARQNQTPGGAVPLQSEAGAEAGISPTLAIGGGAVAGAVGAAAVTAATRFGNVLRTAAKRVGIIGAGLVLFDQITDFVLAFDEEKQKLEAQGFDPDTVEQESARSALQVVTGNIYEGITDGIVIPVSEYALEQLAWSEEDIAEITSAIKDFKSAIIEGTGGFFDDVLRLFQEENVLSFEREAQEERKELNERIAGLKQKVANSPVSEESLRTQLNDAGSERLNFLMDQGLTVDDIQNERYGKLSFSGRQQLKQIDERRDQLREQLQPFDQLAASQAEQQEFEARTEVARRGYETQSAVDRGEIEPLNIDPTGLMENDPMFGARTPEPTEIQKAVEVGAYIPNGKFGEFGDSIPLDNDGVGGVPLQRSKINVTRTSELTTTELLSLLRFNERNKLAVGNYIPLDPSDEIALKQIYRDRLSSETPQLDAGGTIEPGEAAIVGEKGPELVLGPAQVIGREDTARVLTPSPTISAAVPVNEMSSNMLAMSSAPVIISTTQGGSSVTNMVNNNSTNVIGGGPPARSSDVGHRRYQDRMQGVV